MPKPKTSTKTVAFYKIVAEDGSPLGANPPWQDFLEDLHRESIADTAEEVYGTVHYASVFPDGGDNFLVLGKTRDEAPAQVDMLSGFIDAANHAGRPWVELSVIHFLPGTNVVAIVRGAPGSPANSSLAGWLNEHRAYERKVKLVPMQNAQILDKLDGASVQARQVKLVLSPHDLGTLTPAAGGLATGADQYGRDLGGEYTVEVIIKIDGQARTAPPALMRRLAEYARGIRGQAVKDAGVEIVDFADNQTRREWIDITTYGITQKEKVEVVDDGGNNIRIPSAITAIRRSITRLDRYLTNGN